jgi:hypothetical protein
MDALMPKSGANLGGRGDDPVEGGHLDTGRVGCEVVHQGIDDLSSAEGVGASLNTVNPSPPVAMKLLIVTLKEVVRSMTSTPFTQILPILSWQVAQAGLDSYLRVDEICSVFAEICPPQPSPPCGVFKPSTGEIPELTATGVQQIPVPEDPYEQPTTRPEPGCSGRAVVAGSPLGCLCKLGRVGLGNVDGILLRLHRR